MRTFRLGALLLVTAGGCTGSTSPEVSASCVAVLHFKGTLFVTTPAPAHLTLLPDRVVGEVVRFRECDDTPEPGSSAPEMPFRDGDSNFLPPGTKIYSVVDFAPNARLAVRPDTIWIFLGALASNR